MLGRTDSRRRLIVLMLTIAVIAAALGGRLAYWQLAEGGQLRNMADAQLAKPVQAEQRRGDITDRSGTLLATTAYRDRLVAYPDLVPEDKRDAVAGQLAALVGLSGPDREALFAAFQQNKSYVTVARKLTDGQDAEVRRELASGDLVGVGLEPVAARFYPNPGGAPEHYPRQPAARLRYGRRAGSLRHRAARPDPSRRLSADTASIDSGRRAARSGGWREHPADDRCEPSAARRKGALRDVGGRPGQARERRRDGPQHRRRAGLGVSAWLRRQRLRRRRSQRTRPVCRPHRQPDL